MKFILLPPYERYYTLYIKRFQSKDDLLLSVVLWKKNAFSLVLMEFIIEVSKSGGKMMTTFKDGFSGTAKSYLCPENARVAC